MRLSVRTVDKTILVICGCGLATSIVAISRLSTWPIVMEEDHSGEADFINHGERNVLHRNVLPWSYWVAVAASVQQFLAFLLYIIRSDFKDSPGADAAAAAGASAPTGSRQLHSLTADCSHEVEAEGNGRMFV